MCSRSSASRSATARCSSASEPSSGEAGLERKRRMLTDKNLDLVVYNDVSAPGIGFDSTDNEVTLVTRAGERELRGHRRREIAAGIVDEVERLLEERRGELARDPRPSRRSAETVERLVENLAPRRPRACATRSG